ncbi:serine hydrolase domain-containing protein [Streptomyces sp. NPDC093225]|uniref:serine hydrolase domain-containing protein n=1 Tax=Streptomyces sp. NPDC093225 TaxID=3366034 RepID=UPI003803B9C3
MSRHRALPALAALSLLLAALLAGPAPAAAPPPRDVIDPATAQRLDEAVRDAMAEGDIPGVTVGLWKDDGWAYERSFGTSDTATGAPMNADLHTRIGSVTKTFTVTAVLRLVDQGAVALDAPIGRYVAGVPGGDRITVRQLADMRSGLHSYTEDPAFLAAYQKDPHGSWTPRQLLDIAFKHPADFPPGARWEYSNTNTVLLGVLVEKVTGRTLAAYLQDEVLRPAGLADTVLPAGATIPSPYAHGYTDLGGGGKPTDASGWNPSWAWAAGAMTSTLDDLHTWAGVLARGKLPDGTLLLSPGTQIDRLVMLPTGYPGVGYGLGLADVNGWLGHNGELPGYETIAARLPQEDAVLVVIVNSDIDGDHGNLATLVGKAVTQVATPAHVWSLPSAAQPNGTPSPAQPSPSR